MSKLSSTLRDVLLDAKNLLLTAPQWDICAQLALRNNSSQIIQLNQFMQSGNSTFDETEDVKKSGQFFKILNGVKEVMVRLYHVAFMGSKIGTANCTHGNTNSVGPRFHNSKLARKLLTMKNVLSTCVNKLDPVRRLLKQTMQNEDDSSRKQSEGNSTVLRQVLQASIEQLQELRSSLTDLGDFVSQMMHFLMNIQMRFNSIGGLASVELFHCSVTEIIMKELQENSQCVVDEVRLLMKHLHSAEQIPLTSVKVTTKWRQKALEALEFLDKDLSLCLDDGTDSSSTTSRINLHVNSSK